MLSRFRNPPRDYDDMTYRAQTPVRQDNWGTTAELNSLLGAQVIESRDLIDVALPDNHAGPLVVTLSGPDDGLLVPEAFPDTHGLNAELIFGTGGAFVTATCDWIRGQRICVHAGRVRVRAIWQVPFSNATRTLGLGAFAAFGTATGHQPAQLTDFLASLAPLGVQTVRVPYLARRAILISTPANATYNVDFLDPNAAVICNYVVAAYPAPVNIPGGARWIRVTNAGQAAGQPRIIWELDL